MKLISPLQKIRVSARACRIYRVRHERLLREYEETFFEATQFAGFSTWTRDDIVELASLIVTRKLEATRKHARAVKAAKRAKQTATKELTK